MLSLSDICEEEEEEEEDDDDDDNDEKERDGTLFIPDIGKGGSDEVTRLLIGHRDTTFSPSDTCDSINPTPSSHRSINPKGRDGNGSSGNNNDNGGSGCHRHALGELYANGTAASRKSRINANNSHTKPCVIPVIDERAVYGSDCVDRNHKHKDKRKPDLHSPTSTSHSSLISADVKNNHFYVKRVRNTSSCSSSSSPSSTLPIPYENHDGNSGIPSLDPGNNTNSNHVDCDVTNMAHSAMDRAVNVEINKKTVTSICVLLDGKVRASCPPQLQQHRLDLGLDMLAESKVPTARPDLHIDGIKSDNCRSASVDVSSSATTSPSDSLSQSSSSCLSANQNFRSNDVSLPDYNAYQTMIPIHEVKRSFSRKQIIQLSAMTGIGFVFVAFIILWLMSPVLF